MSVTGRQVEAPPLLTTSDALYLDFDGTLANLAPRPDHVEVHQDLPELLTGLCKELGGAVAIVTGRRLDTVDRLLAPILLPGAGLHGAELRMDASGESSLHKPEGIDGLAGALQERFDEAQGILIEDKEAAVALHFRQAPERAEECITAMRQLATHPTLEVITGHHVVEARPRGADKGRALQALAEGRLFAGRHPVFIGDDVTDEDGFRAARILGGHGIKVGDDGDDTEACYRCRSVSEVHDWLRASLDALEKDG